MSCDSDTISALIKIKSTQVERSMSMILQINMRYSSEIPPLPYMTDNNYWGQFSTKVLWTHFSQIYDNFLIHETGQQTQIMTNPPISIDIEFSTLKCISQRKIIYFLN